jgi:hypothetical protein
MVPIKPAKTVYFRPGDHSKTKSLESQLSDALYLTYGPFEKKNLRRDYFSRLNNAITRTKIDNQLMNTNTGAEVTNHVLSLNPEVILLNTTLSVAGILVHESRPRSQ